MSTTEEVVETANGEPAELSSVEKILEARVYEAERMLTCVPFEYRGYARYNDSSSGLRNEHDFSPCCQWPLSQEYLPPDKLLEVQRVLYGRNMGGPVREVVLSQAARKAAEVQDCDLQAYKFSAAQEQLRPPRVVRVGLIQHSIKASTSAPYREQRQVAPWILALNHHIETPLCVSDCCAGASYWRARHLTEIGGVSPLQKLWQRATELIKTAALAGVHIICLQVCARNTDRWADGRTDGEMDVNAGRHIHIIRNPGAWRRRCRLTQA
jgi:hypothetical protein